MKKFLLAGTALVGVAILAPAAQADLKLDLGGHFRGYAVYSDNDETDTAATSDTLRNFDFRRDFEVHFTGETTTDSGLTVGVHAELDLGNESSDGGVFQGGLPAPWKTTDDTLDPNQLDEAYLYFSGSWGRVNFGSEDGAAYLLQVASPSADSNVDGMRVYVQGLNPDVWDDNLANASVGSFPAGPAYWYNFGVLGYDNAYFRNTDRITYLTPKWNGFQAGVSYAPEQGQNAVDNAFGGMNLDDSSVDFENLWEVAARWDGEFEAFGISAGLGFSHAEPENSASPGAGSFGTDDITAWDAGLTVSWNDISVGLAYLKYTDTGATAIIGGSDSEVETWSVGAAWDNGPYHLGFSWYNQVMEGNAWGLAATHGVASGAFGDELDIERLTIGAGYTYGPGMTFRGAVAFGDVDRNFGPPGDVGYTQVTLGTDLTF